MEGEEVASAREREDMGKELERMVLVPARTIMEGEEGAPLRSLAPPHPTLQEPSRRPSSASKNPRPAVAPLTFPLHLPFVSTLHTYTGKDQTQTKRPLKFSESTQTAHAETEKKTKHMKCSPR
jgi:hypothetical protein